MSTKLNMEGVSACSQNECGLDKYRNIVQLHDKDKSGNERPVYPMTCAHAVYGRDGANLESILAQFNNVFLQYQGTAMDTRLLLPKEMRRKGVQISYRNMDDEVVTEKCVNDTQSDNDHWGLDANWMRIDELSLQGEISVSSKGTWVINGEDTGIKALGPKGDNGLTPWMKTIDNKLHYSYDNKTWVPVSDYISAWFRFTGTPGSSQAGNIGKIQISRDNGKTWADLSGEFTNDLKIRGYRTSVELIPAGQPQGAIWGIGPTYEESDTEHTNPIYRLYVKDGNGWVDNGRFTGIAAGVVQELGESETEVISQKKVTEKFSDYTFIFQSGNFPTIEKSNNDETFTVKIKSGIYYYINNTTGELSNSIIVNNILTFDIHAGEMLIFNINNMQFEVVSQHNLNSNTKIILLNNMRYVYGELACVLLNSLMSNFYEYKHNLYRTIIFSQASYPLIKFQSDNSYKIIFKPVNYYIKNWLTGNIYTNTQFLDKTEDERTIIVPAAKSLYYSVLDKKIQVGDTNTMTINIGDILLFENSRYCQYGQLNNAILNETYYKAELNYSELLENYKTSCSIISTIDTAIIPYIKPIRKLHIYVDENNVTDTLGLGVLRNNNDQAQFYIYDVEKSYNICVINIDIPEGESSLRGVTKLYGNYTVEGRITCYLDAVIDWDLFEIGTTTTNPTVLFSAQSTGSLEFKSKFTSSENSKITSASNEFFKVKVNGTKQNPDDGFIGKSSNVIPINTEYEDRCHFVMPANDGNPVKLVILCHGGGVTITDTYDAWYNYQNIGKIFNILGYATLTFNGLPKEWADEHNIGIDRQCGNWMANESIERAYEYVISKYNVDTNGCYVYGQSQGGMVAENVVELTNIPIIASVLESPAISMQYAQLYIGGALEYLQAYYGFNSQSTYDKNKCIGLDPFIRNMSEDIIVTGNSVSTLNVDIDTMTQRKFRKNSPVMIIRSLSDDVISHSVIGAYAKAIINGGGNCELLTYVNAKHSTIATTEVIGVLEEIDIRASLYEILNFFRRHSGYSIDKIIVTK